MFISPYEKVGGIVWFPRMLRKIRLRAEGKLPEDYHPYMGMGFDGRCLRFLRVDYEALVARVLAGGTDAEVLEWCFMRGHRPTEDEILIWNEYMVKRGWRDTDEPPTELQEYKEKYGLGHRTDILTFFDFYEVDEGRRS
jgi:gluconokinase